ncbi:MAG: HD domain-containing protein [Candidatus Cryptobacteroides sp.]|nr:HD domain-containing protein [Bacteroidales bacterium]
MVDYTEMVQAAVEKLFNAVRRNGMDNEQAVNLISGAYALAEEAHRPQKRKSGLPYILHPLAVALIVVEEMRQTDPAIVCAALLHDVVEDTDHTIEEIRSLFGDDVATLVAAVTKPNKQQVDNFQHILGSVNKDVRVLILKLSDRLHNMRTLDSMKPQKQWKIASETQFFFAPLAGRLGLYKVKSELENLAFKFLNPMEYEHLNSELAKDRERTKEAVETFMGEAEATVFQSFSKVIRWDIRYRKPFSIWREMQERNCDFYHVPFKHYIRAVFNCDEVRQDTGRDISEQDIVLKIYSVLGNKFREQTGSFINYMTQPKANGYRSVHFRLLNPYGNIEEFHISSDTMREQSYFGCIVDDKEQWMKRLTSVLQELSENPELLMPGIHDSLYNEDVTVYTPQGSPVTLPKGATALDFAYEIHTRIGSHAKYARINGRLASVRTRLNRGDCIEIFSDESINPQQDWLDDVVTFKSKKAIRNYLNRLPKQKYKLCPCCRPLPGSEIIGFADSEGTVTVHRRNCPDAIRAASENGQTIVAVEDFKPEDNILYPVSIRIIGVDRPHLLRDIIDCVVQDAHLSMSALSSVMEEEIVTCTISYSVHSADELDSAVKRLMSIEGVEEVRIE